MPNTAIPRNTSSERSRRLLPLMASEPAIAMGASRFGTARNRLAPIVPRRREKLLAGRWFAVSIAFMCTGLVMSSARATAQNEARLAYEPLQVGPHERLLVIAPHPDDETLGAGGLAQRVLAQGGIVRTVVVTAGDGYVEA